MSGPAVRPASTGPIVWRPVIWIPRTSVLRCNEVARYPRPLRLHRLPKLIKPAARLACTMVDSSGLQCRYEEARSLGELLARLVTARCRDCDCHPTSFSAGWASLCRLSQDRRGAPDRGYLQRAAASRGAGLHATPLSEVKPAWISGRSRSRRRRSECSSLPGPAPRGVGAGAGSSRCPGAFGETGVGKQFL